MEQDSYSHLSLSENGFLFNSITGNTYTLNRTGKAILSELKRGADTDRIINHIVERFDVSMETAGKDVTQFLRYLKEVTGISQ